MNNIASAFIRAKKQFGPVLKVANNPHFKSKYAPLDACLEAVDEACLNNGIALYQETFEDSTGVTVETVFLHESGEALRCGKLHVPADKQNAQGYGSALTYARRYSLLTACGIASEDDDGNAATNAAIAAAKKGVKPTSGVSEHLSDADKAWLEELAERTNAAFDSNGVVAASSIYYRFNLEDVLDNKDTKTEADAYRWSLLSSKCRSAITKANAEQTNFAGQA